MKPNRRRSAQDGFTLIELLSTLTLVGILAVLLLPTLAKVKARAHSVQCKNRLKQMGLALQMYVHDYGRYPYFRSRRDPMDNDPEKTWNNAYWWGKLADYGQLEWTSRKYHCPGYKGTISAAGREGHDPMGSYGYNSKGILIPGGGYINGVTGFSIRYGTNNLGLGPTLHSPDISDWHPSAVSESDIHAPSEMIAIGDSRFLSATVNAQPGSHTKIYCGFVKWEKTPGFAFDQARHGTTYNLVFCDGRVAAMSPSILFNPAKTAQMWNRDHEPHPEFWIPE